MIKHDKRNYRKHSDRNKALIQKSLSETGAGRSIVIDADNEIIGGNGVFEAWGDKPIQVIESDGSSLIVVKRTDLKTDDPKRKQLAIMDNSTSDSSEFDMELLQCDFDSFELEGFGVDGLGEVDEVLEAQEDDFDVPEGGIETDIVLGDLFEIGSHRLLCGDSTDSDSVAKLMNGEKADMVFTDPPYGYEYESNYYKNGNPFGMIENDDKIIDFMPNIELFTKENAAIFICGSFQTIDKWIKIVQEYFNYKNLIVWKKNNWSMGDLEGAFAGQHELIIFAHKGRILINGKRDTDIWEYDRQKSTVHPTQKPVELISFAIEKTTEISNNTLDLFLGSGSTMVASHQLKRKCYGMELDPKYCQVIVDRMRKLDPTLVIKKNGEIYS